MDVMDRIDRETRARNMSRIRSKDTGPELIVRSILHKNGYRFRLHYKSLPGSPDIVLPMYRTAIFVHGCFWHQHEGCEHRYRPKSNADFWNRKLDRNVERDSETRKALEDLGWKVFIVWECETHTVSRLLEKMRTVTRKAEETAEAAV